MVLNDLLKALHDDRSKCYGPEVIKAGGCGGLWDRDNSGGLEDGGNNRQAQRQVEDVSEHLGELVRADSQHPPWDAVGSWSLARVDSLESLSHCGHVYVECGVLTVYMWSGDRCGVVCVEPSVEGV